MLRGQVKPHEVVVPEAGRGEEEAGGLGGEDGVDVGRAPGGAEAVGVDAGEGAEEREGGGERPLEPRLARFHGRPNQDLLDVERGIGPSSHHPLQSEDEWRSRANLSQGCWAGLVDE